MTPLLWFITGWWACALTVCIALAIWWPRRPINTPMAQALPPTRHEPPSMPACKPAPEPDFFSIAESEVVQPTLGIDYKFLGMTGEEK